MNKTPENSLFLRAAAAVGRTYRKGAIFAFLGAFRRSWPDSKASRLFTRFAQASPAVFSSRCAHYACRLRAVLVRFGEICEKSRFYRVSSSLKKSYLRFASSSVILSALARLGVRRLLIGLFALYLPIDWALRSVASLTAFASVWDELLMVFSIGYIASRRAHRKTRAIGRETPLDAPIFLFLAAGFFLMCAVSPNFGIAVDGYRAVAQYILWFFILIRLVENDRDFWAFYLAFVGLAAVLTLHGLYQFAVAAPIPDAWITQTEQGVRTRVYSITGSPNIFGSFLVLATPMAAALAYYLKDAWKRIFFLILAALMCVCLLVTFSRGAWMGLAAAVFVFALIVDRRLIAFMLAAGSGVLVFVPSVASRITYLFTADYVEASLKGGRMVRWEAGSQILKEAGKLFGFGLGRFGGAVAMQNQLLEQTDSFQYFYLDNYYLKTAVEMGYFGLFFFILMLAALVLCALRAAAKTGGSSETVLIAGLFSGLCGVMAHLYTENIFEVPYMTSYFWGIAAMIIYLGFFRTKTNGGKTPV